MRVKKTKNGAEITATSKPDEVTLGAAVGFLVEPEMQDRFKKSLTASAPTKLSLDGRELSLLTTAASQARQEDLAQALGKIALEHQSSKAES